MAISGKTVVIGEPFGGSTFSALSLPTRYSRRAELSHCWWTCQPRHRLNGIFFDAVNEVQAIPRIQQEALRDIEH